MRFTFLGTGASSPSKTRNVSSLALSHLLQDQAIWLFDCGEGTQHQFLHCPLKISKIRKIFITHLHGDHLFGLPGLLASRALQTHASPIDIYGPKGIKSFLESIFTLCQSRINFPLHIHEIETGTIFEDEKHRVEVSELCHRICCFGFRITRKAHCQRLDKNKLAIDQIPFTHFKALERGEQMSLADGRLICGRDYWQKVSSEKVVAIFGDTSVTESALPLALNADLLVHEATYDATRCDKAQEYGHSTTVQTAEFAKKANVSRLIINHISCRYATEQQNQQLLQECREIFPNTVLATDFAVFDI